ncbi:hypothetical protein RJ639_029623 [Escallonia herrerae]|uniref:lipoyl(octanoyl) transferase n=1 Tax=Escallonia herrerae TaxID=1293975 RepID=A0AA88X2T3_9ASTE|nr:hypothetical protein RJ639_029623 [Escallonia herrerae]
MAQTLSLIILQHHPVYTLGTASSETNLNFDINNAPYVMYPIVNLRHQKMDLHWYLRALEEVVIRVLSTTFSIKACRLEGLTGVWVGDKKLAAMGIRVSHWITYHGLALNVTTDLTPFQGIVPCGIRDRQVGSIKGVLRDLLSCDDHGKAKMHLSDEQLIDITHESLVTEFCKVFQVELCHRPVPMMKPEGAFNLSNRSLGISSEIALAVESTSFGRVDWLNHRLAKTRIKHDLGRGQAQEQEM